MKTSSAKAKGRRAAQEARQLILEAYPELEENDVRVTPSGVPGPDLQLSPKAEKLLKLSFEMKNTERLSPWAAIKQSEDNASEGSAPVVVFKRNRSKLYMIIEFQEFLKRVR